MTSPKQTSLVNRQWTLASRPVGAPSLNNFNFIEVDKPKIQQGEILLRTVFLSLDPYMRGRMNDAKSYAEPVAIDEVMVGGTVCRVEESNHPDYSIGEWVVSFSGWQDYAISDGIDLLKLGMDDELGFDLCVDHTSPDLAEQLAKACDNGIDVYFENVGGKVFDAVLPLLNACARIPLCGMISQYNATELPEGPDRMFALMGNLLVKRIKMQGFIVFDDYGHRYNEFSDDMSQWLADGKIKYREDLVEGLENAVESFGGLLEGKNFGKLVVRVGPNAL